MRAHDVLAAPRRPTPVPIDVSAHSEHIAPGAGIGRRLAAGPQEHLASDELESWWGLGLQDVAILVIDAQSRIVGRMSGRNIDPRPLDPIVQKLTSR